MKNLTSLPLRSALTFASVAILSFGLTACSDDSVDQASSTFSSKASTSTTSKSESSISRDRDSDNHTSTNREDSGPKPTLANDEADATTTTEREEFAETSTAASSNPYGSTMTRAEIEASLARRQSNLGPGGCDESDFLGGGFNRPIVYSCDGMFAYVAETQSDHFQLFSWGGSRWAPWDAHERDFHGFPCWDGQTLYEMGASEDLLDEVPLCD